jgi:hypothetical protein
MQHGEGSKQARCIGHGCIHSGAMVGPVVITIPYGMIACVPLCHRVGTRKLGNSGLETWR